MESINVNLDNLTQDERDQLMKLIEKSNKAESKVWKPSFGEQYYLINSSGVTSFNWDGDGDYMDQHLYSIGNCYHTEEDAEFAIERMKVLTELRRYADEHNEGEINWRVWNSKYFITYDHEDEEIYIDSNGYIEKPFNTYFTSEGTAMGAVEAIGEARIKKYLFNIED